MLDSFVFIAQSVGTEPALCNPSGQFSDLFYEVTSCTSRYTANAILTISQAEIPLSYCSSYIQALVASVYSESTTDASTASLCSSYASIGSSPPASLSLSCSQFTSSILAFPSPSAAAKTDSATQTTSSSQLSTTAQTIAPATTSATASASKTSSSLSTGAIAGIAVGSVIAGILIVVFVGAFIWRHRRAAKKRRLAALAVEDTRTEKPQLHSDSYQPKRDELEGSKVPPKMRVVPGLSELEYIDMRASRGEMSTNEAAAPELSGDKRQAVEK